MPKRNKSFSFSEDLIRTISGKSEELDISESVLVEAILRKGLGMSEFREKFNNFIRGTKISPADVSLVPEHTPLKDQLDEVKDKETNLEQPKNEEPQLEEKKETTQKPKKKKRLATYKRHF